MCKGKKISYLSVLVIVLQFVLSQIPVSADTTVFFDGFETDSWSFCELVAITDETARTGNKSLIVKSESVTSNQASINVNLSKNTEYVMEYYTKSDYEWGAVVQILEGDTYNKLAQGQTAVSQNAGEWKKVTVDFQTTDTPDIRILVLGNLNGSQKGPVYLDDFTIFEKSTEEEPEKPEETGDLKDKSFEEQNGAWTLSENWEYSSDTARTGEYSAKLTGNEEGAYWDRLLKQTVSVEANTDYTVSFYAISNKDWGSQLKIIDEAAATITFTGIGQSEGWKKTELRFNSGENTKITIGFMDQGGNVYIDDVSIQKDGEEEEVTNDYVEPVISGTPADFSQKSELTVGYIGGSITQGAGADQFSDTWVYKTTEYLEQKTGKTINPIYAGVGGTGSDYGIYRLYDHVLKYNPDIVFIEFAINDAGRQSYAQVQRNIEGMIREILSMPKKVSIIMVFTTNNEFGAIDNVHQKVANYYGIPTINIQKYIKERIADGDFTWEDIGSDEVHPNSFGYQVYAEYIQSVLDSDFGKYVCYNTLTPEPMTSAHYNTPRLASVDGAQSDGGWSIDGEKAVSSTADAELTYTFKGQSFGFCHEVSGEGVRVIIDGDDYGIIYTNYGAPYRIVTEELEDTEHTVVLKNISDNQVSISSFMIDDNEAFVYEPEQGGEVTEPDDELVINGGFEKGTDGWSLGEHWSIADESSYSGNYSLKLNNTQAHWCIATQTVTVEPETDYILSYYINSQNHWGGVLKLFYDGMSDHDQQIGFEVTSGWERKTVELYTSNHKSLEIQFMDNGGVAWIDNVILKKADEPPKLLKNSCVPVHNTSEFPVDGKIKIQFDSAMDSETVNTENIKLYHVGNEQEIPIEIKYVNDFEFEVIPQIILDYSTKYELRLSGNIKSITSASLEDDTVLAFTSEHALFDVWNIKLDETDTGAKATVTFKNNSEENENVLVLLKAEKNGCVENITASGAVIENTGVKTDVTVELKTSEASSDHDYTVYVWDSLHSRNPLAIPVTTKEKSEEQTQYAEAGEVSASQNKDTNEITISGMTSGDTSGKQAVITLFYNDQDQNTDTSDYNSVDITNILPYAGQVYINEENVFYDKFIMEAQTFDYPVFVNAASEQMNTILHYYSKEDISGVDDVINSTSVQELLTALKSGKNLEILGIDEELFNTLNQNNTAEFIFLEKTELEKTQEISTQDMSDLVRRGIAVSQLSEAKDAKSSEAVLNKYKDVFLLDQKTGYKTYHAQYMNDAYRLDVADGLRGIVYKTMDDVAERFNEQVVLKAIDYIANIAYIKTILNDNNDTLGWDLSRYNKLSDTSKVDLAIYNNRPYNDLEKMKDTYDDALDDLNSGSSTGGGGSGGTGSGTGGASSSGRPSQSWTVSTDIPQQNNEPEQIEHPFNDLENTQWAREAIESLAERGIVNGSGDGRFRPDDTITREEFVKMLVGIFDLEADDPSSEFLDVPKDAWYYEPVSIAYTLGITKGIDDTHFGTGLCVTRQDMACLIRNCMEYKGLISTVTQDDPDFADAEEISDYAQESVALMKVYGVINGYEDDTFRPKNTATRAEAAVMLYNAEGDIR